MNTSKISISTFISYLFFGIVFGVILSKSEVLSWFRIQEMFRFQAFRMYGIIGTAVILGAFWVFLLKKSGLKDRNGDALDFKANEKPMTQYGTRYWAGGTLFGLGWALTGACPGPMYALVGNGLMVFGVAIIAAMGGVWCYALLRTKLPH